jgi:F-type H+-transporting ATPase subunit delta
MASHSSARRYARALFDVLVKAGDPVAALRDLQNAVAVLDAYPELRKALTSPGVPLGAKVGVLRELQRLQPSSKTVSRLLHLIIEHDDVNELDEVVSAFEQRIMDFHQVVRAEVTAAVPLAPERAQALEEAFKRITGKRVLLEMRVDPAIIGGVVAKIGSRVYDGSIARQLERVRERLRTHPSL